MTLINECKAERKGETYTYQVGKQELRGLRSQKHPSVCVSGYALTLMQPNHTNQGQPPIA